jgi:hypothetical protein
MDSLGMSNDGLSSVNRVSGLASPVSLAFGSAVKRRSKSTLVILFLAIAFLSLEMFCRFAIGLGDPPLYQADSKMEYLLQPSRTYHRFHDRFTVNSYSMRADEFPPHKSSPNELRVLVVGDSIVYGGVRIDQKDIDTEILKRNLQQQLHRPVVVGNASAKSWGPPNELEYLKRYGTLDADVVILELSSHDYADAPTFVPVVGISADYPSRRPFLAVGDLLETYLLPRYLHIGTTPVGIDKTMINTDESEKDIAWCRTAERDFFSFARAHGAKVALMQHLSLPELAGKYQPGYYANQAVAKEENVPYFDDAGELLSRMKAGESPFYEGDSLHMNRLGQQILADTLQRAVGQASN